MKNILFPTLGSAGDVAPLLALSQVLNQRGYRPIIIASPVFQNVARQSNVDFIPLGTERDFAEMLNNADLWHPTRGFSVIVKHGILPFIQPLFNIIHYFEPKKTLIASPLLLFGSHLAFEKDQTPFITLQLQPSLLRSAFSPPVLGGAEIPGWVPPALVRQYYKILDKTLIDPQLAPSINAFRAELGLAPVQRIFDRFLFSPMKNICLFPDWYAPPQTDWPPNTHLTGFIASQNQPQPLSEELQTFLENGEKPLVFTAGTAMQYGGKFYQTAIQATQMLGKRAVLVTRQSNQVPDNLPKEVIHQTYADFSLLLPQAALFIYHGGIGSLAQATAAGIPQLIMPMSQDQPDNAARIRRLGLGDSISPRQFTPTKAAKKMESLLSNQTLQANCRRFAKKIDFKEALEKTCNEIESCL